MQFVNISVIQDNVVVGASRIAYTVPGERCVNKGQYVKAIPGVSGWINNEARSSYMGVVIFKGVCDADYG